MKITSILFLSTIFILHNCRIIADNQKTQPLTDSEKEQIHNSLNLMEYSFLEDNNLRVGGHHVHHIDHHQPSYLKMNIFDGDIVVCQIDIQGGFEEVKNCNQFPDCKKKVEECASFYDRHYSQNLVHESRINSEEDETNFMNGEDLQRLFGSDQSEESNEKTDDETSRIQKHDDENKDNHDIDGKDMQRLFRSY